MQLLAKGKKRSRSDDVDELLINSISMLQENKRRKKELNEEGHFGYQVAATLRRFSPRQKAVAKLRIDQVLLDIELTPEQFFTPNSYHQPSDC